MRAKLLLLLLAVTGLLGAALPARAAQLVCDLAHSRVEIVVKATVDSFTGQLEKFEPTVTCGHDGRVAVARLHFRFADVKTGKEKRDKAMHEWQDTPRFPDGEFELVSLDPAEDGQWLARGRLSFHGQTRDLSFPVSIVNDHSLCAIDGEAVVDTREFGLPVIRMFGLLKVDPEVHVRFHLQGRVEAMP